LQIFHRVNKLGEHAEYGRSKRKKEEMAERDAESSEHTPVAPAEEKVKYVCLRNQKRMRGLKSTVKGKAIGGGNALRGGA